MAALPRKRLQHDDFPATRLSQGSVARHSRVCELQQCAPTLPVSPVEPNKFVCAVLIDAMGRRRGPRALPWSCSAGAAGCGLPC
jgi:hypothetical protein